MKTVIILLAFIISLCPQVVGEDQPSATCTMEIGVGVDEPPPPEPPMTNPGMGLGPIMGRGSGYGTDN